MWCHLGAIMTELRILIYRDEDLYVGQCLEHDLCVQSREIDQIRRLIINQVEFYEALFGASGGLSKVPPAPAEFFSAWEKTTGDPKRMKVNGFELLAMAA
jgi:hypothetical protein